MPIEKGFLFIKDIKFMLTYMYFRVRYMQESMDRKLLIRMMHTWQKRFQIKVKENSAHNHFR